MEDAPEAQATAAFLGPVASPIQQQASKEFALSIGARRRKSGAPVRTIFVSDETVEKPPLARLLNSAETGGGGRGGQLRVKLYISLLLVCAKKPYGVARPARAWAALLGLDDIDGKGVRRIQDTLRDLADRQFIKLEDRGGLPSNVTVLSESGDGSPFIPAPDAYNRLTSNGVVDPEVLRNHLYFRIPTTLWTSGKIGFLKGPSLAMLLALISEQHGTGQSVWFSPDRANKRFGLSPSTRSEGLAHLRPD